MPDSPWTSSQLLDTSHTLAAPLLSQYGHPWQALPGLSAFIAALGPALPPDQYQQIAPQVWAEIGAIIAPSASITGPCIIGRGAEIRHCAFIRGSALIGRGAVVGNSTELKNALLFDEVQVPHFNYVGDSILGFRAHMGAGAITSNVRSDKKPVILHLPEGPLDTGMKKLGAILGDDVEVGCNSVLCPGTLIGRGSIIYPTSLVRGLVPARTIHKNDGRRTAIQEEL